MVPFPLVSHLSALEVLPGYRVKPPGLPLNVIFQESQELFPITSVSASDWQRRFGRILFLVGDWNNSRPRHA